MAHLEANGDLFPAQRTPALGRRPDDVRSEAGWASFLALEGAAFAGVVFVLGAIITGAFVVAVLQGFVLLIPLVVVPVAVFAVWFVRAAPTPDR